MNDKYDNPLVGFGFLVNTLGGGGDAGQSFPRSDVGDLSRGLRFIPGEVTIARRRGELVMFVQPCSNPCCWYWEFQDGSRTYYWERASYEQFGKEVCSLCGNTNVHGGHVVK